MLKFNCAEEICLKSDKSVLKSPMNLLFWIFMRRKKLFWREKKIEIENKQRKKQNSQGDTTRKSMKFCVKSAGTTLIESLYSPLLSYDNHTN